LRHSQAIHDKGVKEMGGWGRGDEEIRRWEALTQTITMMG